MTAKRVTFLLVAALAGYFALIGYRGIYLLGQDRVALRVLGAAVLVLPFVGAWVVVAEIRFGLATARLGSQLDAEGAEDVALEAALPRSAAGRVDRAAADALFELRRADVESRPDDWRAWYRLAIAYDLAGDRRRARSAMRCAIDRFA